MTGKKSLKDLSTLKIRFESSSPKSRHLGHQPLKNV